MLIKKANDIASSEIASESVYLNRRKFLAGAAAAGAAALVGRTATELIAPGRVALAGANLNVTVKSPYSTTEKMNSLEDITHYNNFYEFSTDKYGPAKLAQAMRTRPWKVTVDGEVLKPKTFDVDDLIKLAPMEERIYRHRCVEGWSIVVPWNGYSLSALINQVQPTSKAKFVQFVTAEDRESMVGLRDPVLDWPYTEGLRMDEAMHPLALLCFGMYGQELPKQDGAPIRTVVPWKYGFKSCKSIVHIKFVQNQPATAWNIAAPREYGFYSNVNPTVDHPRWSQATERRLGEFLKRKTLMFNGYDQVASLYNGMDLRKNF
ncbi:MAG TPA: protein-methionine-sulfoxide reductase catalytic subunit MsrP [Candidatus Acidoferrales bacterium]|nr:protein-methionine-sulfoxide reductase catalytic subunit MsrP [Candidatus Acidoferrales bacterium]